MKKILLPLFISFIFASCSKLSNKETEFYVRGNCEMCKERIEDAVIRVTGVSSANWDVNSGNLKVYFDSTKLNEMDMHHAVAAVGHGTKLVEMNQKAHDELPECCKVGNR